MAQAGLQEAGVFKVRECRCGGGGIRNNRSHGAIVVGIADAADAADAAEVADLCDVADAADAAADDEVAGCCCLGIGGKKAAW